MSRPPESENFKVVLTPKSLEGDINSDEFFAFLYKFMPELQKKHHRSFRFCEEGCLTRMGDPRNFSITVFFEFLDGKMRVALFHQIVQETLSSMPESYGFQVESYYNAKPLQFIGRG